MPRGEIAIFHEADGSYPVQFWSARTLGEEAADHAARYRSVVRAEDERGVVLWERKSR